MSDSDGVVTVTRRALLAAGGAMLAPGLPADAAAAADSRRPPDPATGESRALAAFVASTPFAALPAAAVTMTKRSILDAIGVSRAAAGLEPACRPFLDLATAESAEDAVVIGTGQRSSVTLAALGNGALAHALDYEDAHEPTFTHPNAATVAAAVAVADMTDASGKDFIVAVATGCDLVCRLALAQGQVGVPPTAWYPPAIVGTFGATAAAARLLGLTAAQVLDAFSLALCVNSASAEILFSPYSDIRAVRDGFCAQAGAQAALLARRGVKGFDAPFEGQGGFFAMYADGRYVPGVLTDELGKRFAGTDIGFKAWPACRASHIYIQAVLEGMAREAVDPADIAHVRAYVRESDLIICEPAAEKRRPRAAIDAKFSLYYTVATAFLNRAVTLGSFAPAALVDPDVLALADRVDYVVDEQRARPGRDGGGPLLDIRLADGSSLHWGVEALFGSAENPLTEAQLEAKFIDCSLAAPNAGTRGDAERLAARILALETEADLHGIVRRL